MPNLVAWCIPFCPLPCVRMQVVFDNAWYSCGEALTAECWADWQANGTAAPCVTALVSHMQQEAQERSVPPLPDMSHDTGSDVDSKLVGGLIGGLVGE